MKVNRILSVCQVTDQVQDLAKAQGTTVSACGYITCAMVQFLAEQPQINQQLLKSINFFTLKPYITKVMRAIAKNRRMQIKKFMTKMNDSQKKNYLKDWVATFEIADYLESIQDKIINHNIYFWRQVSYDHPKAMQMVKFQQAQRVLQQKQYQGTKHFYSSFSPYKNHFKQEFQEEIKNMKSQDQPIIIATDVLGHFNTTLIINGSVYVLDSLPYVQSQYDDEILQAITYYYKISFLKEQNQQQKMIKSQQK